MLRSLQRRPHPHVDILTELLPDASRSELAALARAGTEVDLGDSHVLMQEGDWGREAYLILDGTVDVSVCGAVIGSVGAGEIVGELAIIDPRRPRMATVRAAGPVKALVFDMRAYRSLYDLPGLAPTMTPVARYVSAA
jgi:CRP-like cAMP-binding protein